MFPIPYRDNLSVDGRSYGVMILVVFLAVVNVPLFLDDGLYQSAISMFGFIPVRFSLHPWANFHTLVTSSVLHADVFHLAGNCLFLVVFGRSLEKLFGLPALLATFPAFGMAGLLVHWALYPDSRAPVIGASGAIAALMGAYLTLFPAARIRLIVFFGWFWRRFTLPAWAFLGFWGGLQVLSTIFGAQDGVAYAVHAGSFVVGVMLAIVWKTSYPFAEERLNSFTLASFSS